MILMVKKVFETQSNYSVMLRTIKNSNTLDVSMNDQVTTKQLPIPFRISHGQNIYQKELFTNFARTVF